MTDPSVPAAGPAPDAGVEDMEYDLAHDARDASDAPPDRPASRPITVVTETPRYSGGDYSYDMAHDIPPA